MEIFDINTGVAQEAVPQFSGWNLKVSSEILANYEDPGPAANVRDSGPTAHGCCFDHNDEVVPLRVRHKTLTLMKSACRLPEFPLESELRELADKILQLTKPCKKSTPLGAHRYDAWRAV